VDREKIGDQVMLDDLLEKYEQLITLLQSEIKDLRDEIRELIRVASAVIHTNDPFEQEERRAELGALLQKYEEHGTDEVEVGR